MHPNFLLTSLAFLGYTDEKEHNGYWEIEDGPYFASAVCDVPHSYRLRASAVTMNGHTRNYSQRSYLPKSRQRAARTSRYVSDGELVRRCILYEDAAWQELLRRHVGAMYAVIAKQLACISPSHNGIEAEDVLGKVFQKVLERNCEILRNLRNPGAIRTYLCQIALTVTVDHLRRELPGRPLVSPPELHQAAADPYETIAAKENCKRLERTLEKLSDRQRLFLRLYYEEDLAYKEIAELTRTPIRTVGTVLHRARKAARNLLREQGSASSRKAKS